MSASLPIAEIRQHVIIPQMSALRIARLGLLVSILAYAAVLAGGFFHLIGSGPAVVLGSLALTLIALSAIAALSLQLWTGVRRKR